jgi:N-acetyl-anhydromuramyl-L-alanine amidase AmpD
MWSAPAKAAAALSDSQQDSIRTAFDTGSAGKYDPSAMVSAGVFNGDIPLRGGIFERREPVKYIIMHSTETESPADGPRVIRSWNRGMRHPGAQFVVDRDGTIYQAVDPNYGSVHVDVFRTKGGINNDNAIGIEIVRAGKQRYTHDQLSSVTKLVAYLQGHYGVPNSGIYGHGQIQPSNRTDPVDFNWNNFVVSLASLKQDKDAPQFALTPKGPSPAPQQQPKAWWALF